MYIYYSLNIQVETSTGWAPIAVISNVTTPLIGVIRRIVSEVKGGLIIWGSSHSEPQQLAAGLLGLVVFPSPCRSKNVD